MRVPTEKQREASRNNGQPSRGPKSLHTRKTTALTRLQHALCACAVVLDNECPENSLAVLNALRQQYQSDSLTEAALIEEMAAGPRRTRRIRAMETAMLDDSLPAAFDAPPSGASPSILAGFDVRMTAPRPPTSTSPWGLSIAFDATKAASTVDQHRAEKQKFTPRTRAG